jgi:hypothetical protein
LSAQAQAKRAQEEETARLQARAQDAGLVRSAEELLRQTAVNESASIVTELFAKARDLLPLTSICVAKSKKPGLISKHTQGWQVRKRVGSAYWINERLLLEPPGPAGFRGRSGSRDGRWWRPNYGIVTEGGDPGVLVDRHSTELRSHGLMEAPEKLREMLTFALTNPQGRLNSAVRLVLTAALILAGTNLRGPVLFGHLCAPMEPT